MQRASRTWLPCHSSDAARAEFTFTFTSAMVAWRPGGATRRIHGSGRFHRNWQGICTETDLIYGDFAGLEMAGPSPTTTVTSRALTTGFSLSLSATLALAFALLLQLWPYNCGSATVAHSHSHCVVSHRCIASRSHAPPLTTPLATRRLCAPGACVRTVRGVCVEQSL